MLLPLKDRAKFSRRSATKQNLLNMACVLGGKPLSIWKRASRNSPIILKPKHVVG